MRRKYQFLVLSIVFLSCVFVLVSNHWPERDVEPKIGAARPSNVSNIRSVPLNFGALVAGNTERYIELTPQGDAFASARITGRSENSFIGDENTRRIRNTKFRIRPGQLSFDVTNIGRKGRVRIKFKQGQLKPGVKLSNVRIEVGGNTDANFTQLPSLRPNVIVLKANIAMRRAKIDLTFGGRLTLASNVSGEVDGNLPVVIAVLD